MEALVVPSQGCLLSCPSPLLLIGQPSIRHSTNLIRVVTLPPAQCIYFIPSRIATAILPRRLTASILLSTVVPKKLLIPMDRAEQGISEVRPELTLALRMRKKV